MEEHTGQGNTQINNTIKHDDNLIVIKDTRPTINTPEACFVYIRLISDAQVKKAKKAKQRGRALMTQNSKMLCQIRPKLSA